MLSKLQPTHDAISATVNQSNFSHSFLVCFAIVLPSAISFVLGVSEVGVFLLVSVLALLPPRGLIDPSLRAGLGVSSDAPPFYRGVPEAGGIAGGQGGPLAADEGDAGGIAKCRDMLIA